MATTRSRTVEDIRREMQHEREQLVQAVAQLRTEATNVKSKLPKIAAGVAAGIVVVLVARRLLTRKRD